MNAFGLLWCFGGTPLFVWVSPRNKCSNSRSQLPCWFQCCWVCPSQISKSKGVCIYSEGTRELCDQQGATRHAPPPGREQWEKGYILGSSCFHLITVFTFMLSAFFFSLSLSFFYFTSINLSHTIFKAFPWTCIIKAFVFIPFSRY